MTDDIRALPFNLSRDDLRLDPITMDRAPDLRLQDLLSEILDADYVKNTPDADWVTLDAALALFHAVMNDPAYNDIHRNDLFGACLHTAIIWCHG